MTATRKIERLLNFNRRVYESEKAIQTVDEWDFALEKKLIQFEGRQIGKTGMYFDPEEKE